MNHSLSPAVLIHTFAKMKRFCLLLALIAASLSGCISVDVKPIHVTVDVNVKVDRALDDFFGDIDKRSTTLNVPKS